MNSRQNTNTEDSRNELKSGPPTSPAGGHLRHGHEDAEGYRHHHRCRHSYEEHLKRKTRAKRLKRWKAVRNTALILFLILALLLIITVLIAPNLFLKFTPQGTELGDGIRSFPTDNAHLRLDYDGIDVSHHQGTIDWNRVGQDSCVRFVYIKATEGRTLVDRNYLQNMKGAREAGIPVGSYHYMTSQSSVVEQFRNFYGVVNRKHQDIIPMIDIEQEGVKRWSKQEIQDSLAKMISLIEQHYYCKPVIYAYARFYNDNLAPRFNNYHLFLARYNVHEPVVSGAGNHNIWQHSDQGIIDGIETPVDLDVFAQGTTLDDIKMPRKK